VRSTRTHALPSPPLPSPPPPQAYDDDDAVRAYAAELALAGGRLALALSLDDDDDDASLPPFEPAAAQADAPPPPPSPPPHKSARGGAAAAGGGVDGGGDIDVEDDGDSDGADEDDVARRLEGARKVRALRRLHGLALAAQPRVEFAADGWAMSRSARLEGDFTRARVRAPLVATGGEFVLWLAELPQHAIYPRIAPYLPAISRPAAGVVGAPSSADLEGERAAYAGSLGRAQAAARKVLASTPAVGPPVRLDLPRLAISLPRRLAFKPRRAEFAAPREADAQLRELARALGACNEALAADGLPPLRVCVEAFVNGREGARSNVPLVGAALGAPLALEAMTPQQLGDIARTRAEAVRAALVPLLVAEHVARGVRAPAPLGGAADGRPHGPAADTAAGVDELLGAKGFAGAAAVGGAVELRVLAPSEPPVTRANRKRADGGAGAPKGGGGGGGGRAADGKTRLLIVELAQVAKKLGSDLPLEGAYLTLAFADVGQADEQLFVSKLSRPDGARAAARSPAGGAGGTAGARAPSERVAWDERLLLRIDDAAFQSPDDVFLRIEVHRRPEAGAVGGPPFLPLELDDVLARALKGALRVAAEARREDAVYNAHYIAGGRAEVLGAAKGSAVAEKAAALRAQGALRLDGALAAALGDGERDGFNGMTSNPLGRCWLSLADLLHARGQAGDLADARGKAGAAAAGEGKGADLFEISALLDPSASPAARGGTFAVADRTVLVRPLEMPLVEVRRTRGLRGCAARDFCGEGGRRARARARVDAGRCCCRAGAG
jgi:hypothetical protein